MARTALTPTQWARGAAGAGIPDPAGVAGDAVNGNKIANDGKLVVRAKNTNGAATARTVTVNFAVTVDGQTVSPEVNSIAAGATEWLGPWDIARFGSTLQIDVSNAEVLLTPFHLTPA